MASGNVVARNRYARLWRRVVGPLATAAAILASALYRASSAYNPDYGGSLTAVILLAGVAFSAAYSGLRAGLASAAAAALAAFYVNSIPGRPFYYAADSDFRRAAIIAASLLALGAVIGYLKRRIEGGLARERALRETAELQRQEADVAKEEIDAAVERITDGFFALDRDERFVLVNGRLEQLAEKPRDNLIGRKISEVLPQAEEAPQLEAARRALREQVPVELEAHYPSLDRWFAVRAYPAPNGVSVYYQDVTESQRGERALRESEERFTQLAGNIREVLWITHADGSEMQYVSPGYAKVWGREPAELYRDARAWLDAVDPADRERVEETIAGAAEGPYEMEYRIRRDGDTRWIWSRGYPVRDADGTVYRIVGVADDVTERKRAEQDREELLERERAARQQVTTILERITDGFIAVDGSWNVTYINPEARAVLPQLLQRDPGDVLGRSLWQVASELVGTGFEEKCRVAMATQEPVHAEERFEKARIWLDVNLYPSSRGLTIYFRDVGERKRVEEERSAMFRETQLARREAETARDEARESANRFAFLAEASTVLATSLDYTDTLRSVARLAVSRIADFCIIDVFEDANVQRVAVAHRDPALEEQLGRARGLPERKGSPVDQVLRSGEPTLVEELDEQFLLSFARSLQDLDVLRSLAPRSLMIVPLVSRRSTLGAITFASTERRYGGDDVSLAEELARRAATAVDNARLYRTALVANQAKADFLAVMSHELRTPLNAILGYADLLRMGVPEPLPAAGRDQVGRILKSTRHLLQLIEELLTFSRLEVGREQVNLEEVDLGDLIRDVVAMIEPLAQEKRLQFEAHLPTKGSIVRTDSRKLRQILINLLSNAVKFTEQGEVSVAGAVERGRILLVVRDTGIGIPPHHREHVFNPFWQVEQEAKRRMGGTGLGLSVSRQLARLLGGDVRLESEPEKGSTFTVDLPATVEAPQALERAAQQVAARNQPRPQRPSASPQPPQPEQPPGMRSPGGGGRAMQHAKEEGRDGDARS